jgi:hypothetical protein
MFLLLLLLLLALLGFLVLLLLLLLLALLLELLLVQVPQGQCMVVLLTAQAPAQGNEQADDVQVKHMKAGRERDGG